MTYRKGYTLIELLVAMGSASVLMVGMSSTLFVASRSLDLDEGANAVRNESDEALERMLSELEEALEFTTLDATTVEFTVPDRDGDQVEETLRYSWSGVAGESLTRSVNGGTAFDLIRDVSSLNFTALTRTVTADPIDAIAVSRAPVVEGVDWNTGSGTSIDVPTPAGTQEGELLLVAVATDGGRSGSMTSPAGWNLIDLGESSGRVTLGVWWKLATASEPAQHTWNWSGNEQVVGWMARISNQGTALPTAAAFAGDGEFPVCPSINVTGDDALVMRIGGFDANDITPGDPGMTGHQPMLMVESSSSGTSSSSGAAYATQANAGLAPTASFTLTRSEEYRTVTVVIPSEDGT